MDESQLRALGRHGRRILGLTLALLCLACGTQSVPDFEKPTATQEQAFREASLRLVNGFLENGWVVSRKPDGTPEHRGEGLIWTGMALGVLPCDLGDALEKTLTGMIDRHDGALVRIEPLGEYENGREVTLDGALGLYLGVAQRTARCPGARDVWAPLVARHRDYVDAHAGVLNERASAELVRDFDYLLDLLASRLAVGSTPDRERAKRLEHQVSTWAAAVNATHAACYRVNLGFMAIQAMEAMGDKITTQGRWEVCAATRGMDIPTVDHWCNRSNLRSYIDSYELNAFEYRFQRCGAWEAPDGKGNYSPALDFLVAMRMAYSLPN